MELESKIGQRWSISSNDVVIKAEILLLLTYPGCTLYTDKLFSLGILFSLELAKLLLSHPEHDEFRLWKNDVRIASSFKKKNSVL